MYPHRIRLRGPWTCTPLFQFIVALDDAWVRSTDKLPPAFRMTMPGRWADGGLRDFRGGVNFLRPFGYPGRIDDFERVWLTFAGLEGRAKVVLNDHCLGDVGTGSGQAEFEITPLLRARNLLRVDVESLDPDGGLWGEVALEIRALAFLKDVRYEWVDKQVKARGLVVGEAPRPLELYLFAGDRFLAYQRVEPTLSGQVFIIEGDLAGEAQLSPLPVHVELIDVATIWYIAEGTVIRPLLVQPTKG